MARMSERDMGTRSRLRRWAVVVLLMMMSFGFLEVRVVMGQGELEDRIDERCGSSCDREIQECSNNCDGLFQELDMKDSLDDVAFQNYSKAEREQAEDLWECILCNCTNATRTSTLEELITSLNDMDLEGPFTIQNIPFVNDTFVCEPFFEQRPVTNNTFQTDQEHRLTSAPSNNPTGTPSIPTTLAPSTNNSTSPSPTTALSPEGNTNERDPETCCPEEGCGLHYSRLSFGFLCGCISVGLLFACLLVYNKGRAFWGMFFMFTFWNYSISFITGIMLTRLGDGDDLNQEIGPTRISAIEDARDNARNIGYVVISWTLLTLIINTTLALFLYVNLLARVSSLSRELLKRFLVIYMLLCASLFSVNNLFLFERGSGLGHSWTFSREWNPALRNSISRYGLMSLVQDCFILIWMIVILSLGSSQDGLCIIELPVMLSLLTSFVSAMLTLWIAVDTYDASHKPTLWGWFKSILESIYARMCALCCARGGPKSTVHEKDHGPTRRAPAAKLEREATSGDKADPSTPLVLAADDKDDGGTGEGAKADDDQAILSV